MAANSLVKVAGVEEAVRLATLLPELGAAYDAGVEIRRVLDDDDLLVRTVDR